MTSLDMPLLDVLLDAESSLTVEALALRCGHSRSAVLAALGRLRASGCRFDEHPQEGVRLTEAGLGTWVDYLEWASSRRRRIGVWERTTSTQDLCRRLGQDRGRWHDGELIVANEQTAGRGRLGRSWVAPAGSAVTFSMVRVVGSPQAEGVVDRLTFATSVAVAEALGGLLRRRAVGLANEPGIKWPNDIYIDGRKVAGILVETARDARGRLVAILGVGVNVHLQTHQLPVELRDRATSLAMAGLHVDRLRVLADLVRAIDRALDDDELDDLLDRWRQRCLLLHRQVRLRSNGHAVEGHVIDLDPYDGLIVRTAAGELVHLPAASATVDG